MGMIPKKREILAGCLAEIDRRRAELEFVLSTLPPRSPRTWKPSCADCGATGRSSPSRSALQSCCKLGLARIRKTLIA
jgi:hypothetical protein